jgi:hypothetical protein
MVQTVQAQAVTLRELVDRFQLELVQDQRFFREWQDDLPELTEVEMQILDRVKESYFNLMEFPPLLEKAVQIAILSPLLVMADGFLHPFQLRTERSIELATEDEELVVRGQMDVLILKERFWLLVIESKEAFFSLEAGLAQLLAYLIAIPDRDRPSFGLLTNGGSFLFIKLVYGDVPRYATSNQFDVLNQGNPLYDVLRILKRIGQLSAFGSEEVM